MHTIHEAPINAIAIDPVNHEVREIVLQQYNDVRSFLQESAETAHTFLNKDLILVAGDTDWYNPPPKFWYGSDKYGFKEFRGFALIVHSGKGGISWASCQRGISDVKHLIKFSPPAKAAQGAK